MNTATNPDPVGTIDRRGLKHLGENMRKMYEDDPPGTISEEMARTIAEMGRRERAATDFKARVEARLIGLTNEEAVFLAECPAFSALCADYASGRSGAYTLLCEIIWLFCKTRLDPGRRLIPPDMTIYDWGGWPRYIGVPVGNADSYWHRFTMALQPKSDAEWVYFSESAAAFAFALMIRHRSNPDFWHRLSWLPEGNLSRASQRMLTALSV